MQGGDNDLSSTTRGQISPVDIDLIRKRMTKIYKNKRPVRSLNF